MPRASKPENDYYAELLSVGPFGGVDPTTSPYYVAPNNYVSMRNVLPNQQYGGYVTVPGRINALLTNLPSAPNGMWQIQRVGQPTVYLFAVDDAGEGAIWAGVLGGTPYALALPVPLTAGQRTTFVSSRQWVFISNGTDTPIKIDVTTGPNFSVTFWGIVAPDAAPSPVLSGVGPLVGTYYYCETFSTALQESSQGVISGPITAAGTPATLTFTIGTPAAGDVVIVVIDGIPTMQLVSAGQTAADVATLLAGQLNVNPNAASLVIARTSGDDVVVTTVQDGSAQNALSGYGQVVGSGGTTITPTSPTDFAGGEDGDSITITPVATTTDPQVTTRNLYRIGGSLGTWNLVHSQPIADMTPYLDVTADDALTGQVLVVRRDPPYAFKSIAIYQDRIVGFGFDGDMTVVAWSNYNEPWGFDLDANVIEAGPNNFDDVAVVCGSIGTMLVLCKTRSLYAMVGQTDTTFTVIPIAPVGCVSAASFASGEGIATWEALRGTQMFNGASLTTISDTGFQQSNVKNLRAGFSYNDISQCVGFYWDRLFCYSYPSQNITTVFDLRSSQWYVLGMALGCVLYDPESQTPVLGSNLFNKGEVDQWFASTTDGDLGNPITAFILSRITDAQGIYYDKTCMYGYIEAPVQTATCNFYIYVNPGPGVINEAIPIPLNRSGTPRQRWELPVGLEGQELQMMIQTISKTQVTIHKAAIYGLIPRAHAASSSTDG